METAHHQHGIISRGAVFKNFSIVVWCGGFSSSDVGGLQVEYTKKGHLGQFARAEEQANGVMARVPEHGKVEKTVMKRGPCGRMIAGGVKKSLIVLEDTRLKASTSKQIKTVASAATTTKAGLGPV